jgi:hypothetical protein
MKSNVAVWGLVVVVVLTVSVVSACGSATPELAQDPVAVDAEALVQEQCAECHGLDRVTRESKSRDEWDRTVVRMVSHGAELNDEEQAIVVDYLAQTYGP